MIYNSIMCGFFVCLLWTNKMLIKSKTIQIKLWFAYAFFASEYFAKCQSYTWNVLFLNESQSRKIRFTTELTIFSVKKTRSQLKSTNDKLFVFKLIHILFYFFPDASDKSDQSTAESWWRSHITTPGTDISIDNNFFSATHGLVQTHPALSNIPRAQSLRPSGSSAIPATIGASPLGASIGAITNQNPKSPFRHLDFATSATAELRRNPNLSAPDECARACREGEPPRICYYHFTLEYYTVLGA